jgi:hypothetical protein
MLLMHKKLTLLLLFIASSGFVAIVFATTNLEPSPHEAKSIGPPSISKHGQIPAADGSNKHVEQTRRALLALRFWLWETGSKSLARNA